MPSTHVKTADVQASSLTSAPETAPPASGERQKVRFPSGDSTCAAWHYPGTNGGCVIMAGGLAVTKEPGTDRFAKRFHEAGFTVLAFDYRHFGESGGQPRQIARIGEQQADWKAAIAFARTLTEVDRTRLAIWGFSSSGGHVFPVASRDPRSGGGDRPNAARGRPGRDAERDAAPNTDRVLRFTGRAILDAFGGLVGRDPLLVPLAGEPGTVTSLTTPDSLNGAEALNPDNMYPDWQQEVAARSRAARRLLPAGRYASRVRCPLLVLAYDDDGVAVPGPAVRAAQRAPRGELVRLPGGHYEPFMDGHEQAVEIQLSFLRRHLLGGSHDDA